MILAKKSTKNLCIRAYFPISLRPSEDRSCKQLSFHFNIIKLGENSIFCVCVEEGVL